MSCVVALREGRRAWIGGDSALSETGAGDSGQITIRTPKVIKLGCYLVGRCGASSFDSVIERLTWPKRHSRRWLFHGLGRQARKLARAEGIVLDGEALIVNAHGLWLLDDELSVSEPLDPFASVGSGCYVALGALHATKTTRLAPGHRIRLALSAAAHFDSYVRPPFTVLSC